MTVSPTSYGSILVPVSLEGELEGILRTSDGQPHRVNQQDFSQFQKPLVKGLIAFAAANLIIGGSIVGFGAYSKSEGATWGSMPFFANSVIGVFGLFIVKHLQGTAREIHSSLSF
ncbi:MAG: hypothetical protein ACH349_05325 [Candidatus Rhabdochlamydia sp.]|jgi:hypothetical protein|nr:hypothetical protein [Chlamydiota bacterium]